MPINDVFAQEYNLQFIESEHEGPSRVIGQVNRVESRYHTNNKLAKKKKKSVPKKKQNITLYDEFGRWSIKIQANGKVLFNENKTAVKYAMEFWNQVQIHGQTLYKKYLELKQENKKLLNENKKLKKEIDELKQQKDYHNNDSDNEINEVNTNKDSFVLKSTKPNPLDKYWYRNV